MRTYDVSPLFRSSIGFDRLFELLNQAERVEPSAAWPPYNIEKAAEDSYRITMAVAGFTPIAQVGRCPMIASFWKACTAASFMPSK